MLDERIRNSKIVYGPQSSNVRASRLSVLASALCALLLAAGCANNSGTRAPVTDLNNSTAPVARTYVVKSGDTINKISRATGVDEATILRLNKNINPNRLFVGQTLRLAEGSDPAVVGSRPTTSQPEARPLDASATTNAPASAPASETNGRASDATLINWGWPAKGKVIQEFTATTKGIDIAGNAGDAVEAAADGKIMFSGKGPRGLGNLIIIDHDNGFITAYGHNRTLLAKEGQKVKKGAKIAEMGQSDADSVRLHFEIRRRNSPVDPTQYLPIR